MRALNPFTPRFGTVPPYYAGREYLLSDFAVALAEGGGDPLLTSLISGARGTGKTAIVVSVASMARKRGWVCATTSAIDGMLEDIYQRTVSEGAHLLDLDHLVLTQASIGPLSATWQDGRPYAPNWRSRMSVLLDQLKEHDTGLLIAVDEVRPTPEMVQLASIYQRFVGEGRKVALVMAGLPSEVSSLLSHEDVSFLRRASLHRLTNASVSEAMVAMRRSITDAGRTIGSEALRYSAEASGGYPYLIQLIGFRMWAIGHGTEITLADAEDGVVLAYDEYERGVLQSTYRDLSRGDVRFLEAMLEDEGVSKTKDIASRLGVSSNYVSKYKQRLVEQGVLGDRGRGQVAFELPHFDEYVRKMRQ